MARGIHGLRWGAVCLTFAATVMLTLWQVGAKQAAPPRGRPPVRPTLKPGAEAPDFELARLALHKNAKGQTVGKISKEKVKLSSFRGKKVVCIFSSSYT